MAFNRAHISINPQNADQASQIIMWILDPGSKLTFPQSFSTIVC